MATGGMGDVLTGIIGAFVCQGLAPLEAAAAGVFIHGKAADKLNASTGFGFTATEVADKIPHILKNYTQLEDACKRQKI